MTIAADDTLNEARAELARCPESVTPRLVFADWLDENGDPVTAALQRAIATDGAPDRVEELAAACERAGQRERAAFIRAEALSRVPEMYRDGLAAKQEVWRGPEAGGLLTRTASGPAGHFYWTHRVEFRWGFPHTVHAALAECASERVTCVECKGAGAHPGSGDSGCLHCAGTGHTETRPVPSPWLRSVLAHHPSVLRVTLTDREPKYRSTRHAPALVADADGTLINARPDDFGFAWLGPLCAGRNVPEYLYPFVRDAAPGWVEADKRGSCFRTRAAAVDALARAVAVWGRMAGHVPSA